MNAETFAEWMRRQGHRVVRTSSTYWCEVSPRVYQAFPYHWVIQPPEEELRTLLRENRAIALRYSTSTGARRGKLSYHVVCDGPTYDLASLPRQARQNIRRGLRYAAIEKIPISRLATEGWQLRLETLTRQGREVAETEEWWRRLCLTAEDLPGFEAWGAIHNGELAATFLAFACDDCYTLPYLQSATAHLRQRVTNAIFYAVTREALGRPEINTVFAGLQSLDAPPSVDEFKFRMDYTARPVRQRVVFHPWLAPLVARYGQSVVGQLLRHWPDSPALAKVEGMVRFYLEGKLPLREQDCPERLVHCVLELLGDA
jgi:hypothetical protein